MIGQLYGKIGKTPFLLAAFPYTKSIRIIWISITGFYTYLHRVSNKSTTFGAYIWHRTDSRRVAGHLDRAVEFIPWPLDQLEVLSLALAAAGWSFAPNRRPCAVVVAQDGLDGSSGLSLSGLSGGGGGGGSVAGLR